MIQGTIALCTHCNTLQHTATHCNTLQHTATHLIPRTIPLCTPCYTFQHNATHIFHFATRHDSGTQCNTLQDTPLRCARTATRCNTLKQKKSAHKITCDTHTQQHPLHRLPYAAISDRCVTCLRGGVGFSAFAHTRAARLHGCILTHNLTPPPRTHTHTSTHTHAHTHPCCNICPLGDLSGGGGGFSMCTCTHPGSQM